MSNDQAYLDIPAVAAVLDVSTHTVRRRIADGTIPAVRLGRLIRVPADALADVGRRIPSAGVR